MIGLGHRVHPGTCDNGPKGWFCTLDKGHGGPCPMWPTPRTFLSCVALVDEWGHAHLPHRVHRALLGRICDWLDRRYLEIP